MCNSASWGMRQDGAPAISEASNRRSTYSGINDSAEMVCREVRPSGRVMECDRNGMLRRSALRYVAFRIVTTESDGTYISHALDRVAPELHAHFANHGIRHCVLNRSQFYLVVSDGQYTST